MKDMIITSLVPIAATAFSALASLALFELKKFIATKTKNEEINAAMTRITETTKTVVDNITQTVVMDYKNATNDGKLSNSQANTLKNKAYNAVVEQVPLWVRTVAEGGVHSVRSLIDAKIEQAVLNQKIKR